MGLLSFTRRSLLKGACILTGGVLLGLRMANKAYAAVLDIKDCMKARINSVYKADTQFLKKASQDNVQVQQLYKQYYIKPLSELAEKELHTEWFDRSKGIKALVDKKEYPNPRFPMFSKMPYPYNQK